MSEATFRPAAPDDVPALHRLIESAYRGDSAKAGWTHEADLLGGQRTDETELRDILADASRVLLLAEIDGVLTGCVQVAKQGEGLAYLGLLTVDPRRQAGGLGRWLIAAAEAEAIDRFGATRMEMTVIRQRVELIAWYERRGYLLTGETRPFPLDDERFGLPQTRELEFVVLEKAL
ncbi:GNAT family N-acetyltransferase [Brevundimonas diminuta]|uniref:Putative acetyltransferase n=1 Tax=Brevundimonas diminuta TaxID=293 RepID=A0A2X1AFZ9_BREDI|nr:GNAT family N-acetyltransferase [Brevundimonas diminuta]OYX13839.1 MAG: GNAT family N-acetyltransferase [Brevundimonas diminuta]SPU42560.1 putative acetyltransferase [Brevundimonas diminuta]